MKKHFLKYRNLYSKVLSLLVLSLLYLVIYKIYIPRVNAFGCSDDCFNFMGGYFLLKGKTIFTQFFYNHQPFTAYLSFFIQYFTHPQSIFELVLRHRQFVILTGFIFNAFLIARFGVKAVLFAVFYELSKFYLFGDRFLAEGMIVYQVIYLCTLTLQRVQKIKLKSLDYILSAVFTWFILFTREPYVPLVLLLFSIIIFKIPFSKERKLSLIVFIFLCVVTLFSFNIPEYFFNVVTVNLQVTLPEEVRSQLFGGPLQMFLYPIFIFTNGPMNIFKTLLIEIDILFLIFYFYLLKEKKYRLFFTIFLILGFSNFKVSLPGKLFYESFHMLIWYGEFIFITLFLIFRHIKNKKIFAASLATFVLIIAQFVASPSYFAKEKISTQDEFINNFGQNLQEGEVFKLLSTKKSDTLFLDGSDDLVYFQSGLSSDYRYSWYSSVMPNFPKYTSARIKMFRDNPPDFYRDLGFCSTKTNSLPDFVKTQYVRLLTDGKPSCLFINKNKLKEISDKQREELVVWHYSIPQ